MKAFKIGLRAAGSGDHNATSVSRFQARAGEPKRCSGHANSLDELREYDGNRTDAWWSRELFVLDQVALMEATLEGFGIGLFHIIESVDEVRNIVLEGRFVEDDDRGADI